ncbi:alpha/beta hydrolase [Bosea sp. (in: a-proteobacteria)]|uniref:alpha/beta hydrolase n=1 Tax=Bosea sp. (in: a-proteobacteria) TaxID=1871050 RepID=UPI003B3B86B4
MTLFPALDDMLRKRAELGVKPFYLGSVEEARRRYDALQAALQPDRGSAVRREVDHVIEGAEPPVRVRLFEPFSQPCGTILFVHGGGWIMGSPETFAPLCRELATVTGMTVASVDYRLAPEHPYPAPLDDAYAALCWAADQGPGPLIVMGDSSGGNLAAACALKARDQNGPPIALQVLLYPVLHADFTRSSYRECGSGDLILATGDVSWFWDQYAPNPESRHQHLVSPLLAQDLRSLPPAILCVARYDPVRDDGMAYAERLRQAGVPVILRVHDDMIHGFFGMIDIIEPANAAVRWLGDAIRTELRL